MSAREAIRRCHSGEGAPCYVHAASVPPELAGDISTPASNDRDIRSFLWISRADHVTPTHFDSSPNVLAQIVGSKTLVLFAPDQFDNLYVHGCDHRYARHSQVFDLEGVDLERHPRIAQLTGHVAELGPGEALYIPNFWWHCAYSRSFSVSINTWWNDEPFDGFVDIIERWADLRADLFAALPEAMPIRYKAYLSRVLLFADLGR